MLWLRLISAMPFPLSTMPLRLPHGYHSNTLPTLDGLLHSTAAVVILGNTLAGYVGLTRYIHNISGIIMYRRLGYGGTDRRDPPLSATPQPHIESELLRGPTRPRTGRQPLTDRCGERV